MIFALIDRHARIRYTTSKHTQQVEASPASHPTLDTMRISARCLCGTASLLLACCLYLSFGAPVAGAMATLTGNVVSKDHLNGVIEQLTARETLEEAVSACEEWGECQGETNRDRDRDREKRCPDDDNDDETRKIWVSNSFWEQEIAARMYPAGFRRAQSPRKEAEVLPLLLLM